MKIYFIGILGISQHGLALLLKKQGHEVCGSDGSPNEKIQTLLKKNNIEIYIKHNEENIKNFMPDLVVINAAINDKNEELAFAKQNNIQIKTRAQVLGDISKNYKQVIAVAGSHGKTTTTALINATLSSLNPTTHCGGEMITQSKTEATQIGNKKLFITEACEYKESFLSLSPDTGIILNIEADHLDYYKNLTGVKNAFKKFLHNTKKNGTIILNADDKNSQSIIKQINNNESEMSKALKQKKIKLISFGLKEKNKPTFLANNILLTSSGIEFDVIKNEKRKIENKNIEDTGLKTNIGNFSFKAFGQHNVYNALVAVICGLLNDVDVLQIQENANSFCGVKRRFEVKDICTSKQNFEIDPDCWKKTKHPKCFANNNNSVKEKNIEPTILHDYAHHPTEIAATLKNIKQHFKKPIITIFEPHTFTRTQKLEKQFIKCFNKTDYLILTPIYPAREEPIENITSENLVKKLKTLNKKFNISKKIKTSNSLNKTTKQKVYYAASYNIAKQKALELAQGKPSIIAILGAGDIVKLFEMF
jgi:UDP-N-acetylmuramate--alanine ligase